jgi:hypothetical protein
VFIYYCISHIKKPTSNSKLLTAFQGALAS